MGLSKKEEFSARQNKVADIARALGHPARIAILEYIVRLDSEREVFNILIKNRMLK